MSVRKASLVLRLVPAKTLLLERVAETPPSQKLLVMGWQADVRLDAERAQGISAAFYQEQVRSGLLSRFLVLGADYHIGPHRDRPEVARRLLAHLDAIAEAGLSMESLLGFAEEVEFDRVGTFWALTLLFYCIEMSGADDAFEGWLLSLDEGLFSSFSFILEIADALRIQPGVIPAHLARRWILHPSALLRTIALEVLGAEELSTAQIVEAARLDHPWVHLAVERFFARAHEGVLRPDVPLRSWMDFSDPEFAFYAAKARLFQGDFEPISRLRMGDPAAISVLGPFSLDLLALLARADDDAIALSIAQALPTTAALLSAMGRLGLPSLFPRLLAELSSDEFDDDAEAALGTALGAPTSSASAVAPMRYRAGERYSRDAVLKEMQAAQHSAMDLRVRADELLLQKGKRDCLQGQAFGVTLEGLISELTRMVR